MSARTTHFRDWLEKELEDDEFRAAYEALEPAYQIIRLRIQRGLTQKELAELVGTSQPVIARFESGKMEPRLSFLRKVAEALGACVEVRVVPSESPIEPQSDATR